MNKDVVHVNGVFVFLWLLGRNVAIVNGVRSGQAMGLQIYVHEARKRIAWDVATYLIGTILKGCEEVSQTVFVTRGVLKETVPEDGVLDRI